MTLLPEFRLESYFSRWEFTARFHLTASDAETVSMAELLDLADDGDREAWESLRLGYTTTFGDPDLRTAIASMYESIDADDVICFAGAEEGLYLAMHALLGPGDHAVVVTPNYQAAETVPLSLCEVSGVPLRRDEGWRLDVDDVRAALRPTTRLVSINVPNNPTGAVMTAADARALAELCDERGIHLFSDEVYRGLELDRSTTMPQAADLSARGVSLNVTSKSLGLPGLRVGWIATRDRDLRARLEGAKHYTTICNAGPSEVLARIAVKARERMWARNRAIIAENLPHFDAFFAEHADRFEWTAPQGGCVAYPRYLGHEGPDVFCARLVEEAGVLLLPAGIYRSELTPTPTDHVRIGIGRRNPGPALQAWHEWLQANPGE